MFIGLLVPSLYLPLNTVDLFYNTFKAGAIQETNFKTWKCRKVFLCLFISIFGTSFMIFCIYGIGACCVYSLQHQSCSSLRPMCTIDIHYEYNTSGSDKLYFSMQTGSHLYKCCRTCPSGLQEDLR